MKLLFIGVCLDGTGYGQTSVDYIHALDAAGIDVVVRPLKLNGHYEPPDELLKECLAKSTQNIDCVVQHALPGMMAYNGKCGKNIGIYAWETDRLPCHWPQHLNLMDMVCPISNFQEGVAKRSGVVKPIYGIPQACDTDKFMESYDPPACIEPILNIGKRFRFYTIGEFVRRKNWAALLRAFHEEFHPDEPVDLIIKTSDGQTPEQCIKTVTDYCDKLKKGLRLRKYYKQEYVITKRLTNKEIYGLHNACDCFVTPSYGEAWCIPAMDAMGFGKTPIVTAGLGTDYLTDQSGWLVNSQWDSVYDDSPSLLPNLYTSKENWRTISVPHLRQCMRQAYTDATAREAKSSHGLEIIEQYSYHNIGQKLKVLFYEQTQTS